MKANLFIVFLRRPGKKDHREDPYWEFGSFGCTGCHGKNLLNPRKDHVKEGARLAFVQGGSDGCKLLLITPPVTRWNYGTNGVEIRWAKTVKPLCYSSKRAPVLAKPESVNVALAGLGRLVNNAKRPTAEAKLASCFRARCQPLDSKAAGELRRLFQNERRIAGAADFIKHYSDALPRVDCRLPRMSREARRREYAKHLKRLSSVRSEGRCGLKKTGCRK